MPQKTYHISHRLPQQNLYEFVTLLKHVYNIKKNPRKTNFYQTSKTPYNILHVLSQQNSYGSVTILKHVYNIGKN
jgi:hypothetical protein